MMPLVAVKNWKTNFHNVACYIKLLLLLYEITNGCLQNHPFGGKLQNFHQMKEVCISQGSVVTFSSGVVNKFVTT